MKKNYMFDLDNTYKTIGSNYKLSKPFDEKIKFVNYLKKRLLYKDFYFKVYGEIKKI